MHYYYRKHAEKQKLPVDFPSSLSLNGFDFVLTELTETAMEQHQPADNRQECSVHLSPRQHQ